VHYGFFNIDFFVLVFNFIPKQVSLNEPNLPEHPSQKPSNAGMREIA
jgi:hypothetical protein